MKDTGIGSFNPNVPVQVQTRIIDYLDAWVRMDHGLPKKAHGTPTYVARFDCAPPTDPSQDPAELIYELEHDPGGLGMVLHMEERMGYGQSGLMHTALARLQEHVGPIKLFLPEKYDHGVLVGDLQLMQQHLGAATTSDVEDLQREGFFFARGTHEDVPLDLQPYGLTTGRNGKGFMPGLFPGRVWFAQDAPAEQVRAGGVLKPTMGHWAQSVAIMPPQGCHKEIWRRRPTGAQWKIAVETALADPDPSAWIWQSFIAPGVFEVDELSIVQSPPDTSGLNSTHLLIYRIYFVYVPSFGWTYAGGAWSARPSLLVHGARNAVFGLVS